MNWHDVEAMKAELSRLRLDLAAERSDAEQLRRDVRSLKAERDAGFARLGEDLDHLRRRVDEMNEAAERLPELIAEAVADLRAELAQEKKP